MMRAGSNKSSFLVPRSLARIKLTLRSSAASLKLKFNQPLFGLLMGYAQVTIWIGRGAALRSLSD